MTMTNSSSRLAQDIARIAWACIKECADHQLPPVLCVKHQIEAAELLAAALSLGSAGPQWQPIETAPKDGTRFLAGWSHKSYGWTWAAARRITTDKYHPEGYWHVEGGGKPTHWMPLPDPLGGSAGPPAQESPNNCESRSPDGDGRDPAVHSGSVLPDAGAARNPDGEMRGHQDSQGAGSEPADSHQSVAGASAGAVAPLDPIEQIKRWREDSDILRHSNIIEIAVRNESRSVNDYMAHWESRALKAEAEIERRRRADGR